MKSNFTYSLLDEAYSSEDAREVVARLMEETIRFHHMNSLRSWETEGAKDEYSEQRIEEIKEKRENIIQKIKALDGENVSVEINTKIKVTAEKPADETV